jgi:TolB-like protein
MKKIVPIILVIIFYVFLSGCAADRKIIGNTFQSDYPKLNIKIDPEFKYLDKINRTASRKSIDGSRELLHDEEYYLFVSEGKGHEVRKNLYIYFNRIQTKFIDTTAENKNNLDFGVINFTGHNFKYYKRIERTDASGAITKYLMDAGHIVPTCILRSAIYIIPYKDLWITINYWEDATTSGMSCKSKYSMDMLSDEQKVYLIDFHSRALAAIGIGDAAIKQPMVTIIKETSQPVQKKGEVKSTKSFDIQAEQKQAEFPQIPRGKDRIKIAIVEFLNLNEESKRDNMGSMFSEMLTTSFVGSEAFRITEREQLQKVANELKFNQSGIIDVSQAKQVGKMVGADAIVTGSVTKIGGDLRLDARIIDVESGIILTAEKIMGKTDLNSIGAMADKIVESLVNKFYRDKK